MMEQGVMKSYEDIESECNRLIEEKEILKECCRDLAQQKKELERELRVANSKLNQIYGSDMYRLSLKYYHIRDRLFPQDSAQLRLIKRIVHKLKRSDRVETEQSSSKKDPIALFHEHGKFKRMGIVTTPHTMYVAALIQKELEKLSIESMVSVGEPEEYIDAPYIIICPQFIKRFPPVYIVFQMEQTVSSRWFTPDYFLKLQNSCAIFDYSLSNVEFFHKPQNRDITSRVYYLPIDYCSNLSHEAEPDEKEYDVVFYGDANSCQRRRDILNELSKRFKVKICSELFGEDVYREIRKAKVLVNIHYYEGALLETTRLYETLSLNTCVVVSEDSKDKSEQDRLNGVVDFVSIGDVEAMKERIEYWVTHEEERKEKIRSNQSKLENRPNAFTFFFQRFLLAYDRISFDEFYHLAGNYVHLNTNRLCLSLPESTQRRRSFDKDNRYGFECVPGLRHEKGWVGCGLSYKLIFTKALEMGMNEVMICEDDVIFPKNFEGKIEKVLSFLHRQKHWSVFSGVMADVGEVNILGCEREKESVYVNIDHMISMVFNIYNKEMFEYFCNWDEQERDVHKNAIDRYLENKELSVFTRIPFLVGHKEELNSTIWGFSNIEYSQLIANSEEKLRLLAAEYIKSV